MNQNTNKNLQDQLQDSSNSNFANYRNLAIGTDSLWYFIKYEIITTLVSNLPGALGFVMRKYLYPTILGSVGRGVIFGRGITIRHGLKINIANQVTVDDYVVLDAKGSDNKGIEIQEKTIISRNVVLSCKGADIHIGKSSTIGINSIIHARDASSVFVGDHVLCGAFCYLIGGGPFVTEKLDVPFKEQGLTSKGGVIIEPNVWLGSGVQVMDGVKIGTGSIIGSNAVVNKAVERYSVSAGVPAKLLKVRTESE